MTKGALNCVVFSNTGAISLKDEILWSVTKIRAFSSSTTSLRLWQIGVKCTPGRTPLLPPHQLWLWKKTKDSKDRTPSGPTFRPLGPNVMPTTHCHGVNWNFFNISSANKLEPKALVTLKRRPLHWMNGFLFINAFNHCPNFKEPDIVAFYLFSLGNNPTSTKI